MNGYEHAALPFAQLGEFVALVVATVSHGSVSLMVGVGVMLKVIVTIWLDRLAKQLVHEVIIDRDFVNNRFADDGGAKQMDQVLGAATIPNEEILINTLTLQEARHSSEIENIITTQDDLYRAGVIVKSGV